jgi:hypothetical protein
MAQALGTVLPLAVAIAIFPVPVIAAVLLIRSDGGRMKGLAFAVAWCGGLLAVGAAALLLADGADASEGDEPATWVSVTLLGLGVAFLLAALKKWRGRPRSGEEPSAPGWMRKIDEFTMAKAALSGFALTALNPKNVALVAAAAAEIAAFGLQAGAQVTALLAFVGLASLGVLGPLALSVVAPVRSRGWLGGLQGWMARNDAVIMAVLLTFIGAKLIGDAVIGFI